MKIRKEGRKLMALFLGLMLLLLPFAFSLPTLAEDNPPEAVVNPDADKNPVTPGSGNELPPTPDTNSNNGNSETPVANPNQPGTPGNDAPGTGTQNPENSDADTKIPDAPVTPEEAVIDPVVPGISPAKDAFPNNFRKAPPLMSPTPGDIAIKEENFPDDNFRESYVRRWDFNSDGILSKEELSRTDEFLLHDPDIPVADLRGLDYFTSLRSLTIGKQQLNKVDVSSLLNLHDLSVSETPVSEITFGHNPYLFWFCCVKSKLTSVDVSTLNNLSVCSVEYNQLTNLTLGKHPQLIHLVCNNNF